MTRTEYLAQLDKYLKKLPRHDYQEAMDYFVEYFDEAGPENESQVIAELGSPREAAHEIMVNLLDKIIEEDEPKNTKNVNPNCYPIYSSSTSSYSAGSGRRYFSLCLLLLDWSFCFCPSYRLFRLFCLWYQLDLGQPDHLTRSFDS